MLLPHREQHLDGIHKRYYRIPDQIEACYFAAFESLHGLSEKFHATEVPAFLLLDQTRDLHFENFADEDVQESCHILVRRCLDESAQSALTPFARRIRANGTVSLNCIQPHRAGCEACHPPAA